MFIIQKNKSIKYVIIFLILILVFLYDIFVFNSVSAQEVILLEPLPSPGGVIGSTLTGNNILSTYLKNIFNLSIGASGILAVLMIVIGGVQYVGSSVSPSQKEEAKKNIQGAVLGLIIVIGAYAILYTINPDLINIKLPPLKL